jgi:hypothetical protein
MTLAPTSLPPIDGLPERFERLAFGPGSYGILRRAAEHANHLLYRCRQLGEAGRIEWLVHERQRAGVEAWYIHRFVLDVDSDIVASAAGPAEFVIRRVELTAISGRGGAEVVARQRRDGGWECFALRNPLV